MKVQFTDVGRNKRSWEATMRAPLNETALRKQVKANGQILSNTIEFVYDSETNAGMIFVGGFRAVGTFKVIEA